MFKDLTEFEESRNVMMGTIEEYKSAEGVDYIHWIVCGKNRATYSLSSYGRALFGMDIPRWTEHALHGTLGSNLLSQFS